MTVRKIVIRFCKNIGKFCNEINKRGVRIFFFGGGRVEFSKIGCLMSWKRYNYWNSTSKIKYTISAALCLHFTTIYELILRKVMIVYSFFFSRQDCVRFVKVSRSGILHRFTLTKYSTKYQYHFENTEMDLILIRCFLMFKEDYLRSLEA